MINYLSDILILTGCLAIIIAFALISPILALLVGGCFCVVGGIILAVFRWLKTGESKVQS